MGDPWNHMEVEGYQMNPPTDLHSSQNQSSMTSSGSLNPPSAASTLPKIINSHKCHFSQHEYNHVLLMAWQTHHPGSRQLINTPPSTQHTGFGEQDPSIHSELPPQQFDNPANPQGIPCDHSSVTPDKISKSVFSEGTHTEHEKDNASIPPPPFFAINWTRWRGKKPVEKFPQYHLLRT